MMVNLQWEHESCSSVEYDKPQFEQTTISSIHSTKKGQIKTSQISIMEVKLLVYVEKMIHSSYLICFVLIIFQKFINPLVRLWSRK